MMPGEFNSFLDNTIVWDDQFINNEIYKWSKKSWEKSERAEKSKVK
jgi:hypothetical protein